MPGLIAKKILNMGMDFSPEQKQVAAVFKQYRNTIDIYTEDKDADKEFYVRLYQKLLSGTDIEINDIHPLGCCREVETACKEDHSDRRRIYVVDGDIMLQYKEYPPIEHLFRLDSYCIENYIIDEDSISAVAHTFNGGRINLELTKAKIGYNETLDNLCDNLINLFFLYSIQHEIYDQFNLMHIHAYVNNGADLVNGVANQKINTKINEIRHSLIQNGITQDKIDQLLAKRKATFPYTKETILRIVSGKTYLIPLFIMRINHTLGCAIKIPAEAWKFNMVAHCDLSRLYKLKEAIIRA